MSGGEPGESLRLDEKIANEWPCYRLVDAGWCAWWEFEEKYSIMDVERMNHALDALGGAKERQRRRNNP